MTGRRKLTDQQIARAIELREKGMSLNAIGRIVGLSGKALSWHFLALAVDPPKPWPLRPNYHLECPTMKRGDHVVRAFTPEDDAKLLSMEAQGMRIGAIARALGRRWNSTKGRLMTLARREERSCAVGAVK